MADSSTWTGYNRRVMPPSAVFLLAVIPIAAILLIATRIRADLVALLTLVTLALSGLVTPAEAFAGFSSSAVITILSIFIISEAMQQTGLTLCSANACSASAAAGSGGRSCSPPWPLHCSRCS